jgi:protein-disulfide isomerase
MAVGSAYTVQVVVKTLSGNRTLVTNTASVSSASTDPVGGNNSATVTTTVNGRK